MAHVVAGVIASTSIPDVPCSALPSPASSPGQGSRLRNRVLDIPNWSSERVSLKHDLTSWMTMTLQAQPDRHDAREI
ncbi:hypothetical protein BDW69DRAFT_154358 [Aspergillus filifer]